MTVLSAFFLLLDGQISLCIRVYAHAQGYATHGLCARAGVCYTRFVRARARECHRRSAAVTVKIPSLHTVNKIFKIKDIFKKIVWKDADNKMLKIQIKMHF